MTRVRVCLLLLALATVGSEAWAQMPSRMAVPGPKGCDELFQIAGLVWRGTTPTMTLQQLAAYAAPVYWLSPDEPTLHRKAGRDIRVPLAFPFEPQTQSPVVYYQYTAVASRPDATEPPVQINATDKGASVLNLAAVGLIRMKYIAYFPEEAGVGEHTHDVEPAEFRLIVGRANGPLARDQGYQCSAPDFLIVLTRVTGEAHGNPWYYNVLDIDRDTTLPIHLLVEEGKHAMATDKNADGYYTPGYDVSARINDAWGVRDTIRGGTLFTGSFEAWMAKVRQPQHRVLPPLPPDSRLHERVRELGIDPAQQAVYELRPYPSSTLATDEKLRHKIQEKETPKWPVVTSSQALRPMFAVMAEGRELKPFSVAYRVDGQQGVAISFPLLVLKNVPEPLTGGYLVNRFFVRGSKPVDFGWQVMYTPSASRWFDQYLAAGVDVTRTIEDDGTDLTKSVFAAETGFKFRFRAPVRALEGLMPFWGIRMGVRSRGALDIDGLTFIFEFGGGVW